MDPLIIYQSEANGTISEHIKHIFEDNELDEGAVVRLFRTTAADGTSYEVAHYSVESGFDRAVKQLPPPTKDKP